MLLVWRPVPVGSAILLTVLLAACGPATPPPAASDDALAPVGPPTATWTALPTATIDILFAPPTPRPARPRATPTPGVLDATPLRSTSVATTATAAPEGVAPQPATATPSATIEAGIEAAITLTPAVIVVDGPTAAPPTPTAEPPSPAPQPPTPTPQPPTPSPEPLTPTPRTGSGAYSGPFDPFGSDRDCGDFGTHAEAQAFFVAAGGPSSDPHRLDSNNDGAACESLP